MRIAILSDSHDHLEALERVLELVRSSGAEMGIHLGEIVSPFAARLLPSCGMAVAAVYGNNDGARTGLRGILDIADPPRPLLLGGRQFILHHDPLFNRQAPPPCDYCL